MKTLNLTYDAAVPATVGDDVGFGRYTNRWGRTSISRVAKAVAWLGEVVPGMSRATLLLQPNGNPADPAGYSPCVVEFAYPGGSGNETTTQLGAVEIVAMASTARVELLNTFLDGAGANIYVPAPDFKDDPVDALNLSAIKK